MNTPNTNTLFVNLLGGPGTGKSTEAAAVFSKLKKAGVNAELIQEYAKDRTWQNDFETLGCQPYVTGKQLMRQFRVNGKVDVAVTDTSILLGKIYQGFGSTPAFEQACIEQFNLFNNLTIFLQRNPEAHPYNEAGRSQKEEEAMEIDAKIKSLLLENNVPHIDVRIETGDLTSNTIVDLVKQRLTRRALNYIYIGIETCRGCSYESLFAQFAASVGGQVFRSTERGDNRVLIVGIETCQPLGVVAREFQKVRRDSVIALSWDAVEAAMAQMVPNHLLGRMAA